MPMTGRKNMAKNSASTVTIPWDEWAEFLQSFGQRRHGWLVTLETYDLDTRERVVSHETPLQSIELDLEDEKNPRINITVKLDNKVIKHILFQPSQLIWYRPQPGTGEALHIESVNTVTTVRFRAPISP
jgi:hypothetical protein